MNFSVASSDTAFPACWSMVSLVSEPGSKYMKRVQHTKISRIKRVKEVAIMIKNERSLRTGKTTYDTYTAGRVNKQKSGHRSVTGLSSETLIPLTPGRV